GLEDDPVGALERAVGLVEATGRAHGLTGLVQGTFGVTDGNTLWAVRYASEGTARTLYASNDIDALQRLYPDNAMLHPPTHPDAHPPQPARRRHRLRADHRPAGRMGGDPAVERRDRALRRRDGAAAVPPADRERAGHRGGVTGARGGGSAVQDLGLLDRELLV